MSWPTPISKHTKDVIMSKKYEIIIAGAGIIGLAVTIVPLVRAYGIVGAGISAIIGALTAVPVTFYFVLKFFSKI